MTTRKDVEPRKFPPVPPVTVTCELKLLAALNVFAALSKAYPESEAEDAAPKLVRAPAAVVAPVPPLLIGSAAVSARDAIDTAPATVTFRTLPLVVL